MNIRLTKAISFVVGYLGVAYVAADLFGANGLILVGGLVLIWFSGSDK